MGRYAQQLRRGSDRPHPATAALADPDAPMLTSDEVLPGTSYNLNADWGNTLGFGQNGDLQYSANEVDWVHYEDVSSDSGMLDTVLRATGQFWRVLLTGDGVLFNAITVISNTIDLDL